MRYTVVWLPSAQNEPARLWTQASDKRAVTDAANRIDRELCVDADRKGHPLGLRRIFRCPPLVVLFDVDPGDCMVTVVGVRRMK
jgi:hypothetical protein